MWPASERLRNRRARALTTERRSEDPYAPPVVDPPMTRVTPAAARAAERAGYFTVEKRAARSYDGRHMGCFVVRQCEYGHNRVGHTTNFRSPEPSHKTKSATGVRPLARRFDRARTADEKIPWKLFNEQL